MPHTAKSSLGALRKFASAARERTVVEAERCELCSLSLPSEHRHLLETLSRKIVCACDPCALRFQNVVDGRFKLVPRDARALSNFQISDAEWEALALPINLAFFFYSTSSGKMTAMYPSPAGATESELHFETWSRLVEMNPVLRGLEPDAEGLIVNRMSDPAAYAIAPIDRCYMLVGLIKASWEGISGGAGVERAIEAYFDELRKVAA